MARTLRILKRNIWQNFLISCWAFIIAIALVNNPAGKVEGAILPVVSPIGIIDIETTDFGSVIEAYYTKYRDCDFRSINWELDDESTGSSSSLVSMINRDIATKSSGTYTKKVFVNATEEEIKEHGAAYVTHRCHPFYQTITKIYGK